MKTSQGQSLDFDSWYEGFLEQQRTDLASLEASEDNGIVLQEIKKILKTSSVEMAKVSDPELTELARSSFRLSVDEKKRDLEFFEQNRDIIKLNKAANLQEQDNVKKLISSNNFDPSKSVLEYGFKSVSKDMDKLIKNTKPRSLIKIISDLMGPMGPIVLSLIKFIFVPLSFALGLLGGLLFAQYVKLKAIGQLLTLTPFYTFMAGLKSISKNLKFLTINFKRTLFHELPRLSEAISDFIKYLKTKTIRLFYKSVFAIYIKFQDIFDFVFSRFSYILKTTRDIFVKSKITNIIRSIGRVLGNIGYGILRTTTAISNFTKKVFQPITEFFKSGTGRLVGSVDSFTLGIFKFAKWGFKLGKILGGLLGPLQGILTVFEGLPLVFAALTSGNFRTAIKGALALITQILLTTLSTIFLGPIGALAVNSALTFERVFKYFDPIFDIIIDVASTIFDLISSVFSDFVLPVVQGLTEIIGKLFDGIFTILTPIFKLFRLLFILLANTIVPVIKLSFKALAFVFGYLKDAILFVYDNAIKPAVEGIADMFNVALDYLTTLVNKVIKSSIEWYNRTLGKIFGEKELIDSAKNIANTAVTKTTEIVKTTTKIAEENIEDGKDWFKSLSGSLTTGISDVMSKGDDLGNSASGSINSLIEALKEQTETVKEQIAVVREQTIALTSGSVDTKKMVSGQINSSNSANKQMQYAESKSLSSMSQQDMMNSALGYKPRADARTGDTIVNNVTNNTSGSGGGMIPMISSGHMDPTKVALQISYRPPG